MVFRVYPILVQQTDWRVVDSSAGFLRPTGDLDVQFSRRPEQRRDVAGTTSALFFLLS
jgi:hypothetical protein